MDKQIIWHQQSNETFEERVKRLNETLHRIFFDSSDDVCPVSFPLQKEDRSICTVCGAEGRYWLSLKHSTPRFLQSLDAMQLIVTSRKLLEVKETFLAWAFRSPYECSVLVRESKWHTHEGRTRQDAFYLAALKALGYTVITEEQGDNQ